MKLKTLFIAITMGLSLAVSAKEVKKSINTDASVVSWMGKKKIVNDSHNGKIKVKEGSVVFDKKGQPQSAEVVIDMATITNEDLKDKKYNQKLVSHLSNADFFDVTKYPTSVLSIKSFEKVKADKEAKDLNLYKAIGELQIKDKKQPISFEVSITQDKGIHKGLGKLTIDRTLWDVKYGSDSFFKGLGDKVIANEMDFDFELVTKN